MIREKNLYSESRIENINLNTKSITDNFGPDVLLEIPDQFKSNLVYENFKNFTYADIDQTPVHGQIWHLNPGDQSTSSQFTKKIKNTNLTLYNVTYTMNEFAKRKVENQSQKLSPTHFIISAGDSFTFGEGVSQGEDYPSQLASVISSKWYIYNYGVSGDSANDFYLRGLADANYFEQIKEETGDFIWLYHDIQLQRLIFPTNAYRKASYIASKPEYTLNGDTLIFHGFFNSSDRTLRKIINILAKSEVSQSLNLEIPSVFTENNFRLFFTLLNNSVYKIESYNKKINRKILITYFTHNNFRAFSKIATEFGFEVFDIEQLLYFREKEVNGNVNLRIPVDGHPSAAAYWLLSGALKFRYYQ